MSDILPYTSLYLFMDKTTNTKTLNIIISIWDTAFEIKIASCYLFQFDQFMMRYLS